MYRLFALVLLSALCAPVSAAANCVEQQQKLRFDEHTVSTIKSYLCTVGDGGQVRVEFYELSGVAAGMVLGHSPLTAGLASLLGTYRLNENIVGLVYSSLFENFASSYAIRAGERSLFTRLPTGSPEEHAMLHGDKLRGGKVKAILENPAESLTYPITTQLGFVADQELPPGTRFYYWGVCEPTDSGGYDCRNPPQVQMMMWRGMTATDLTDYRERLSIEKQLVRRGLSISGLAWMEIEDYEKMVDDYVSGARKSGTESYLEFVRRVAGDQWPRDFLTLELAFVEAGCSDGDHWSLDFTPRDMALRVARIANESAQPIEVDGLLGTADQSADLRAVRSDRSPALPGGPIDIEPVTLPPGESLVVPIQIRFPAPKTLAAEDVKVSDALFRAIGSANLRAKPSDYGIPDPRDYAYGPEIRLAGIRANGRNVEFVPRSANFVEMVASYEEGSCPYLMVWDQADREWVDHGKVLHDAKGEQRQETEVVPFPGFASRFRLEEREPELAFIDRLLLEVSLGEGTILRLSANEDAVAQLDGKRLQLYRDEAVEIVFELPQGVSAADVVESRLHVTGFYRRYTDMRTAAFEANPTLDVRGSVSPSQASKARCATPATGLR